MSEEKATAILDLVRHHQTIARFSAQGLGQRWPRNFEQFLRLGEQLAFGQATVAICNRFHQGVFNPSPGANHRALSDSQSFGNKIGRFEADAHDVSGKAVRISLTKGIASAPYTL